MSNANEKSKWQLHSSLRFGLIRVQAHVEIRFAVLNIFPRFRSVTGFFSRFTRETTGEKRTSRSLLISFLFRSFVFFFSALFLSIIHLHELASIAIASRDRAANGHDILFFSYLAPSLNPFLSMGSSRKRTEEEERGWIHRVEGVEVTHGLLRGGYGRPRASERRGWRRPSCPGTEIKTKKILEDGMAIVRPSHARWR